MDTNRPSDAEPRPDKATDGALSPGSTATGAPTATPKVDKPEQSPDPANPDALVEGNRVTTAEDME